MSTEKPTTLLGVLERLYRLRWWTSAVAITALVLLGTLEDVGVTSWVGFAALATFVWLPTLAHWGLIGGRAFRQGLNGE